MPEPQWHVAAAPLVFGAIRLATGRARRAEAWIGAVASVAVDSDHFVDMAYYRRTHDRHVQIVPLHAWEFIPVLLSRRSPRWRALGWGLLVHYLMDATVGGYSVRELSLCYRLLRRFRTGYLGDWVMWPKGPKGWGEVFHSGSTPEH